MKTSYGSTSQLSRLEKKLLEWGRRSSKRAGEQGILLEGVKLVREAMDANHPLEMVWFTEPFRKQHPDLVNTLSDLEYPLKQVGSRIMKQLSSLETPPGIVAVGSQPNFIFRQPGDPFSLIVVLCKVQHPGNLGGVIRSGDYFGADEVWLGNGSADPYGSKTVRGSMGAIFRLPVVRPDDLNDKIRRFHAAGATVWAASANNDNAEVSIAPAGPRILLIGGESRGLTQAELDLADHQVRIPGSRRSESLNLSVAAGILIFQATAGRWSGGINDNKG